MLMDEDMGMAFEILGLDLEDIEDDQELVDVSICQNRKILMAWSGLWSAYTDILRHSRPRPP